jgi:hypothetical protein
MALILEGITLDSTSVTMEVSTGDTAVLTEVADTTKRLGFLRHPTAAAYSAAHSPAKCYPGYRADLAPALPPAIYTE